MNTLRYKYQTADVLTKLIVINVAVYLIVSLGSFFMAVPQAVFVRWFVLSNDPILILMRPWTLITYGFLHFGFFHLLFNMIWLWWFGRIVLNLFNGRRFLTIYLLGALAGGALFTLSYNLFPVFQSHRAFLIGASGAVTAIMVFIAAYTPNTEVRIFTFSIKLWHIALTLFLLDLLRIPSSGNAGGLLAHVGGGIFGYVYAVQLTKGNDIGKWFENFMDWIVGLFKKKNHVPFKKVHRNKTASAAKRKTSPISKSEHQKKIDTILDKISQSGYESLSKEEKDYLFRAGKDD